jgi:hypothetical protein
LVVTKQTKAREGANVMLIIGCDFHPSFQQVAIFDNQTGEIEGKRLQHREPAEQFYRSLPAGARIGMEACGHYPWFERLLAECGHELWLGDAGAGVGAAQAEDGPAGCRALAGTAATGAVSADLGAEPGGARRSWSCCPTRRRDVNTCSPLWIS